MTSLPVIAYHALADARTPIAVAPRRFAATMRAMREAGWRSLAMHEVLAGLRHGEWPARSFALHFDDGFQSVRDHAVPVLDACGFTATVFVVASWWAARTTGRRSRPACHDGR